MCVSIFPSSSPRSFWLGSKLRCYPKVLSREVWTYEGCAIYSHEEPISEKNLGTVDDENSQHSYFWHWKFFTCKIQILRKSVHYEKDNKNFLTSKKILDFDLGKGTSKSAVLSAPCARYCVSVWDCQNNCPYKKLRGQTRREQALQATWSNTTGDSVFGLTPGLAGETRARQGTEVWPVQLGTAALCACGSFHFTRLWREGSHLS